MKKILVLGAGRSSYVLIERLLATAALKKWLVDIADLYIDALRDQIGIHNYVKAIVISENDNFEMIQKYDLVISMLPPHKHFEVAKICVKHGKHLITASYNTVDIQSLNEQAIANKSILLMECGLDPGLDHMSAMQLFSELTLKKNTIVSFKSYCGGLMSKEADQGNPWKYKVTWNPRNVVLAGQGGIIKYLEDKAYKYLNYARLFQSTEQIMINNNLYEGYPNRDSLKYIPIYRINTFETFIRGTLRKEGFCKAWNVLVQLGLTSDEEELTIIKEKSVRDYFYSFLPLNVDDNNLMNLNKFYPNLVDENIIEKIKNLGLLSENKISIRSATPAKILQILLEKNLKTEAKDKDLIVMQHQIEYIDANGVKFLQKASLELEGKNHQYTAMATTVGLPLYFAAELLLDGHFTNYGIKLPIESWIYTPILKKMSDEGIKFHEETNRI